MRASTSIFVNREKELSQIREAVETLKDGQRLLRTPIIEYNGVQGIGKTTLLRQIEMICHNQDIPYITESANQVTARDFNHAATLIQTGPAAMILDSLEAASDEQLRFIETKLSDLIETNQLFVILGSRNAQKFERAHSLARKLTIVPLDALRHDSCLSYFEHFSSDIPPDTRDIIMDWTHGYPLAMDVMTSIILDKQPNLTNRDEQRHIVKLLMNEVVEEKLLATVSSPEERTRLQKLLSLLSIPRRFNLILMQDLIKEFESQYELANSLAYINLPKDIDEVTSVLSWNLERAGYCIDNPVRNLFLVQYRIMQPQKLRAIHTFLAEKNKQFIHEVSGSDRIRCLREFFYHFACSEQETQVREALAQQIEQLAQVQTGQERTLLQSYESLVQFFEEFQRDYELKEALGPQNTSFALSLMYRNFLEIYRKFPENKRGNELRNFFSLVTRQPQDSAFDLIFETGMRQIIKQVSREDAIRLYHELTRGEELKVLLGGEYDKVTHRIDSELLGEEVVQNVDVEQKIYWAQERD